MEFIAQDSDHGRKSFYKWAAVLSAVTVTYNLLEGAISIYFGLEDGTITLFGFGVDSFVEVLSGLGIWHMIRRMRENEKTDPDRFEKTALKVTGAAFYILSLGLILVAVINIFQGYKPETTVWGIIISLISILTMWLLMHYKMKIGRRYNSPALIADGNCTKTCLYLSVVLLTASIGYEVTGLGILDPIGATGIAVLSFREGKEAFEKARGNLVCSCQGGCQE